MISIPDFIKGIETDDPIYDVTHNFGKMMVLYGLLGGRQDLTISTNHVDIVNNGTMFEVRAETKTDASHISQLFNVAGHATAYGIHYTLNASHDAKTVSIAIRKEAV